MRDFAKKYLIQKTDSAHIQFLRYIFVGGFAAIIDVGSFMILAKMFSMDYRIAVFLSFSLGTLTNFILSNTFVFDRKTLSLLTAGFRHYISSIGGLVTNEIVLIIMIGVIKFGTLLMPKLIATGAAFLVNFTLIKYFAFNSNIKLIKEKVHE